MKTGTFNQFIRGGIAFATPPGTPLAPKAQEGKHFLLQEASRKSGVNGEPLCRVMPTRPGQRGRGEGMPHAPVSRAGAFVLNCAPLFFAVVRCPWLNTVYFPEAFLAQMRAAMPSRSLFDDFIAACQRPLRRSIRVNTLKISVDDFLSGCPLRLALTPVPWCAQGFWIEREDDDALPLGSTAEHLSGLFYIQEASSMLPVAALFADNRTTAGDGCRRRPGSKNHANCRRMGNAGGILANEFSASRVKVLHANISRCGISNVALTHFDGRVWRGLPKCSMPSLLDAPAPAKGLYVKTPMR